MYDTRIKSYVKSFNNLLTKKQFHNKKKLTENDGSNPGFKVMALKII